MLALTRKTDYALIALVHLARAGAGSISARQIAAHYGVPLPLLMNILKTLAQEGLIRSVRGAKGGYSLALRADQITLDRLIGAIEGPVRFVRCVPPRRPAGRAGCELVDTCPVRSPVQRLHRRLREFLSGLTLADLAEERGRGAAVEAAETRGPSA